MSPTLRPLRPLHPMEERVVRLVSLGCTLRETAAILNRSVHAVDSHKSRAMRKLSAHNLAVLTRRALAAGITTLDDRLSPEELRVLDELRQRACSEMRLGPAEDIAAKETAEVVDGLVEEAKRLAAGGDDVVAAELPKILLDCQTLAPTSAAMRRVRETCPAATEAEQLERAVLTSLRWLVEGARPLREFVAEALPDLPWLQPSLEHFGQHLGRPPRLRDLHDVALRPYLASLDDTAVVRYRLRLIAAQAVSGWDILPTMPMCLIAAPS